MNGFLKMFEILEFHAEVESYMLSIDRLKGTNWGILVQFFNYTNKNYHPLSFKHYTENPIYN